MVIGVDNGLGPRTSWEMRSSSLEFFVTEMQDKSNNECTGVTICHEWGCGEMSGAIMRGWGALARGA